ncbi:helix-turn-helix domain-containing protein [Corynebacterium striatum]
MANILTTAQVAERLGIAHSTVTHRVRTGKLVPLDRLAGGHYVFDREAIEAIARAEKVAS